MYAVVQIGSRIARFECGTMRRTFGSPCAIAAPAPAVRVAATTAAAAMREMGEMLIGTPPGVDGARYPKRPVAGKKSGSLLADVPVEVARADHQPLDSLAYRGRGNVFAER